jgi:hypothetical protein
MFFFTLIVYFSKIQHHLLLFMTMNKFDIFAKVKYTYLVVAAAAVAAAVSLILTR